MRARRSPAIRTNSAASTQCSRASASKAERYFLRAYTRRDLSITGLTSKSAARRRCGAGPYARKLQGDHARHQRGGDEPQQVQAAYLGVECRRDTVSASMIGKLFASRGCI